MQHSNIQNTSAQMDMLAIRRFLSVCVLCFFLPNISARHYLRFNVDFSYARDFASAGAGAPVVEEMSLADAQAWIGSGQSEALRNSNGFAPAVGFGYRFEYKAFLLDVGVGAEYRYTINRLYPLSNVMAQDVDDTGEPYTGKHTWSDRRTTMQHVGINLPIMVGAEFKGVYFLLGAKANIDVWGRSVEQGAYTMTAKYDRFMDEWTNVAGHGMVSDEPYKTDVLKTSIGWDIRACGEVGYCFNGQGGMKRSGKAQPRYAIGAFAEYAFIGNKEACHPLLAGIRLTILLPISEPHTCNCLND